MHVVRPVKSDCQLVFLVLNCLSQARVPTKHHMHIRAWPGNFSLFPRPTLGVTFYRAWIPGLEPNTPSVTHSSGHSVFVSAYSIALTQTTLVYSLKKTLYNALVISTIGLCRCPVPRQTLVSESAAVTDSDGNFLC